MTDLNSRIKPPYKREELEEIMKKNPELYKKLMGEVHETYVKEDKTTHKTVTVTATMETDLYLTLNVPIDWDHDRIYEYARDVDGSVFNDDGGFSGSWYVSRDIIDKEFDPDEEFIHTGEEYQM